MSFYKKKYLVKVNNWNKFGQFLMMIFLSAFLRNFFLGQDRLISDVTPFLPYSMYTRKGKTYPVLFSLLHCKVAPPLSLISLPILSVSLLLWRHIPRGGAWDWKNSDLYYSLSHHGWIFNDDKKSCLILENCYKLLKHQQMIKNIFFAKNFIFFWFVYFLRINRQSPIILLLTKSLF